VRLADLDRMQNPQSKSLAAGVSTYTDSRMSWAMLYNRPMLRYPRPLTFWNAPSTILIELESCQTPPKSEVPSVVEVVLLSGKSHPHALTGLRLYRFKLRTRA
jgi:hypothetical protein